MILCTTDTVPGRETTEAFGIVYGATVRGGHAGHDVNAMLKNLVGGEIEEYTKLLAEAREQALDRLIEHARSKGADAVVCLRFTTSEVAEGAAEFMAYGTAVKLGG
jgi:uncharacterized protein YbjQ (UPF0145 family)